MAIREPFEPESVKDWALIIHADSSGERVDVYWVDINAGREGLKLAHDVKAWRRRDDLLTIAHRLHVVIPPDDNYSDQQIEADEMLAQYEQPPAPIDPPSPVEGPSEPVAAREGERLASRAEWLTGRVRAILEFSDTASKALARIWPEGVPGLKHSGHSWDQLDLILDAVEMVETNHSIPFYPNWDDPAIEQSKLNHPSYVWSKPKAVVASPEDKENISTGLLNHRRSGLMRKWIGYAINGGIDHSLDTTALAHALYEFGNLDENEWPDDDLTVMLDGSLRALGYLNGCDDLGKFNPEHAPLLMSAAFAITAGSAILLFDDAGKPIVRTNVRKPKG